MHECSNARIHECTNARMHECTTGCRGRLQSIALKLVKAKENSRFSEFSYYICNQIPLSSMKITFTDSELERLYVTGCGSGPYKKLARDKSFVNRFVDIVNLMKSVNTSSNLSAFSFLHYEKLKHERQGQSSVRIVNGRVERLIFRESEDGIAIDLLEINDTHYGSKR